MVQGGAEGDEEAMGCKRRVGRGKELGGAWQKWDAKAGGGGEGEEGDGGMEGSGLQG